LLVSRDLTGFGSEAQERGRIQEIGAADDVALSASNALQHLAGSVTVLTFPLIYPSGSTALRTDSFTGTWRTRGRDVPWRGLGSTDSTLFSFIDTGLAGERFIHFGVLPKSASLVA
jgi:hypothetical protein